MGKKLWLFLACMLMTASMAFAQKQVTGTVIDASNGEPLVGVAVRVAGTPQGVLTDANGKYSITLPANAKMLNYSFMGMKTQELAARNGAVVKMESDTKALDEVMVVAFGTSTKQAFTGSASVLDSKDLEKHVTTNVANALVGTVTGLQMRGASGAPGAGAGSINIRGISSMYAGTEPLVIVDGAPYSGSLSNINQSDIESVTVLKDASSAALYGARGANGVILVTTKRGKGREAEINVDMKWGANTRAVQDYNVITDPGKYYETYYGQLFNNYYFNQGQSLAAANANANNMMLNHLGYNIYTLPDGEQLIGTNGKLNPNATLGREYVGADGETYYLTPDNWQDAAYNRAFRQQYDISVKGGNERGGFFASVGYLDEDGIIQYSDYQRINARLKADYRAKKWLKLSGNVAYTNSLTNGTPGFSGNSSNSLMYYTSMMAPIYPLYVRGVDENGKPYIKTDAYGHQMYDYGVKSDVYNGYPGLNRPFLSTGNPLGSNRYDTSLSRGNKFNGNFDVEINFTDWLKFNYNTTIDWGHTNYTFVYSPYEGSKTGVHGQVTKEQTNSLRTNNIQSLTFAKTFGKHDVLAVAGHEYHKTNTYYLGAQGLGMFTPEIKELNAVANFSNAESPKSYSSSYNIEGYFMKADYNYDQKYFVSASYRRDASSYFHKDNWWGNFWSAGAAWLLNKESFLSDQTWIDMLKLKVSVGQQGNDALKGGWNYIDLYTLTPSGTYTLAPTLAQRGNGDITWETTTATNVGIEWSFWNGRLTGGIDFYNKTTADQLFWMSTPESTGARGYYGNMGDARNYGVEVELAGDIIRTKNITWNVSANLAHNKNKITALPEYKWVAPNVKGFTESDASRTIQHWMVEGGSMYNAFLPKFAGLNEQGEALYWHDSDCVDEEGNWVTDRPAKGYTYKTTNFEDASYYDCGSMLPKVFGGFGTTLKIYDFDLSATFDYQIGGKVYDTRYQALMSPISSAANGGRNFHKDVLKAWSVNNTESDIPRLTYADQYTAANSDRWLTNASYLNFQSFTVGYTIPAKITSRIGINKVRLYCTGENLCFWSARKGLDPRYGYSSMASNNVYSPVRTIMGGVQVTF